MTETPQSTQNNTGEPEVLPEVRDEVESLIRAPVIGNDISIDPARINREWQIASERMRRDVLASPIARSALAPLAAEPLSEALPSEAASAASEMPKILKRLHTLEYVLALSSVPEEAISPDIQFAPGLADREWQINRLSHIKREHGDEAYNKYLGWLSGDGITGNERTLITLRYRQARDVKLLAFMAELIDEPGSLENIEDDLVGRTLQSGVKMVMTTEAATSDPDILNPAHWQGRQVIKDRVHAVIINGKENTYSKNERQLDTMTLQIRAT